MPPPPNGGVWETREGSGIHALLFGWATHEVILRDFAKDIASNMFLFWAAGQALDAQAAEFGIYRFEAQPATVTVTFVGVDGTIVPVGTVVNTTAEEGDEAGSIGFTTTVAGTVAGGYVDIPALCQEDGRIGNVSASAISFLATPIPGITGIENAQAAVNGIDSESDDDLRIRAIVRASKRPQGGNKDAYITIALEEPTVADGYVEDLWNVIGPGGAGQSGVGSARLVVSGAQTAYVDPATIDRLQTLIDPSVLVLAHFESPEVWGISSGAAASAEQTAGAIVEGGGSWRVHPATSQTTVITRTLAEPVNLSAWGGSTDEWWVEIIRTTAQANFGTTKIVLETGDGLNVIERAIPNGQIATGRIVWTTADWSATTGTVAACLAAVKVIRFSVTSTGSGSADVTIDSFRARDKLGGRGDGLANVGIQITVRSAKYATIDYTATVTLAPGVSLESITPDLNSSVGAYLAGLQSGSLIRITGIANAIHDTIGVLDYTGVQIRRSGGSFAASNIQLDADERPRFGAASLGSA